MSTHIHKFTLEVKTHLSRQQAELAVLHAFCLRNPDNCEFTLNPVDDTTITTPTPPPGYKLVKGIDIKDRVPEGALFWTGSWVDSFDIGYTPPAKTCWRCFGTGQVLRNARTGLLGPCTLCSK